MMRRTALLAPLALGLMAVASPASAQTRSWVPWGEIGSSSQSAPRGAAWSPGGQLAAPRSSVKYPPILQGGAQPSISPEAPGSVPFTGYSQGSIVIDTAGRSLYYVTSSTSAYKYPISVGRDGFTWRGTQKISRVQAWPDWRPPAEMRQRDPNLPEVMTGGINNPLGAKALYLGSSLYRIHGTNDSRSIGYAASSGCFRMMNSHVTHLATLAGVGTTVHVLDTLPRNVAGGGVGKRSS